MTKKKDNDKRQNEAKSNPLLSNVIGMFFDLIKHAVKDFEQTKSIKRIDKFTEQFSTLEHLIIKLENKIQENRREIENLKTILHIEHAVIFGLLITIVIQLIR